MIEQHMAHALRNRRLKRLLRLGSIAGITACAGFIMLGLAVRFGLVTSYMMTGGLTVLLAMATAITLLIMLVIVFGPSRDRHQLAADLERAHPQLQDRLVTLDHFQDRDNSPRQELFLVHALVRPWC